jgi:hypothetical protein
MLEQYTSFTIDTGVDVKQFVADKLSIGYNFYSLYGEKVENDVIKCKTFTLPQGEALNNFIDRLLTDSWAIKTVMFSRS